MKQEERVLRSRELILQAAIKEFGSKGYDNASINHFCQINQISKGRLYHHFKNKEEIFFACAEMCYKNLVSVLEQHSDQVDSQSPLEKKLHDYFAARLSFFGEHRHAAVVMFNVVQNPPLPIKNRLAKMREHYTGRIREILFHILGPIPLRRGVSMNMVAQIFVIASNYVHLTHGYPNWNVEEDMSHVQEENLKTFDQIISVMLYGIIPRDEDAGALVHHARRSIEKY